MTFSNFKFYSKKWGESQKETKFLQLTLPTNIDKTNKLSLNNTHIDFDPTNHEVREDPKDPLCAIKVFKHFWYHYAGIEYTGRIFCRQLPKSELRRRRAIGDLRELDPNRPIGKHSLSK